MRDAQNISAQSLPNITYAPGPNASPEAEISALAAVYRFVLVCCAKKEAAPENRPDDGTKVKEDSANEHHSK
jgi:hypothetical protein